METRKVIYDEKEEVVVVLSNEEISLIFNVLTNHTEDLARIKNDYVISNTRLRNKIVEINDIAYKHFNR